MKRWRGGETDLQVLGRKGTGLTRVDRGYYIKKGVGRLWLGQRVYLGLGDWFGFGFKILRVWLVLVVTQGPIL